LSKTDPSVAKKERKKTIRWVVTIFLITVLVSGIISFASDALMEASSMIVAFLILLLIVFIGIVFDIVGMAVATADEKPFHSMAARKVPGAQDAIRLLRNAERVSSICNDVVGDICGVVGGAASAAIAVRLVQNFSFAWPNMISLVMSALVAGLTVGGKAIGKTYAVNSATSIVHMVGKLIFWVKHLPAMFSNKKIKR
jgi:CBS domain containing-hemolysin-like protein